jgi:hypothetical protein
MKPFFLIFFVCCSFFVKAQPVTPQNEESDSSFTIPMITVSYAKQWTGSDMANRFGANNNIGGSFAIKTKNNWYFGFKGNFLWGANVKENTILDGITSRQALYDKDGNFAGEEILGINSEGNLTEIFLDQRGASFFLFGGRLFNVIAPNKNSGILAYGGLGTLHHKITIKYKGELPTLTDDLKKGYDRLSFGFALNGFLGYLFLSKNRLLNFYGGFDITQGWTKSLRKYNYDTQSVDNETHSDLLYGIRLGWIIRLNKRKSEQFYYY